ncbi:MAG TPA: TlpA family protein disulfide reductase [Deltaproteobacteria bacterium]|nr:TlpA family protein disulfide reductase [Deltaproteobacteria bacterium]
MRLLSAGTPLRLLAAFVVAAALLVQAGCDDGGRESPLRKNLPNEGDPAPDFTLRSFDGEEIALSTLKGSPVVLNFWASWCGPCRSEAEDLEKVWQEFRGSGVRFIGVAIQDTEEKATAFIEEFGLTYPNGLDDSGEIAAAYKIYGVPKTFVIDRQGRFSYIHMGAIKAAILVEAIKEVL